MKKTAAVLLALLMVFPLCACGNIEDVTAAVETVRSKVEQLEASGRIAEISETVAEKLEKAAEMIGTYADSSFAAAKEGILSEFPADLDRYTAASSAEIPAEGIREIEISWLYGNIRVETYDGSAVQISESCSAALNTEQQMRYSAEKDGALKIISCAKRLLTESLPYKELTVRIPSSLKPEELEIGSVDGDALIQNLTAEKIRFETVKGDLKILDSAMDELKYESVAGNADLEAVTVRKEAAFETVTAEVTWKLPPEVTGFTLKQKGADFPFYSDLPVTVSGNTKVYGDGSTEIEFDTITGTMHIS